MTRFALDCMTNLRQRLAQEPPFAEPHAVSPTGTYRYGLPPNTLAEHSICASHQDLSVLKPLIEADLLVPLPAKASLLYERIGVR